MIFDKVPYRVTLIRYIERSRKSRICSKCGKEIPKGDPYLQWKPLPTNKHWFSWVDRCVDCKPNNYDEHYHNLSDQIKRHKIK